VPAAAAGSVYRRVARRHSCWPGAASGVAAVLVEIGLERELTPAARALVVLGSGVDPTMSTVASPRFKS